MANTLYLERCLLFSRIVRHCLFSSLSFFHLHPNSTIPVICPGQFSSPPSFCMSFLVQPLVLCCFILLLPSAVYCHALSTQLPFSITWLHQPVGSVYRWLLLCLLVVVSFFSSVLLDCFLLPQPEGLSPAKFQFLLHPNIRFFSKSHNFLRTRDAFLTLRPPLDTPQPEQKRWNIFVSTLRQTKHTSSVFIANSSSFFIRRL